MCMKGYPSSDSGPSKRNFHGKSPNSRRLRGEMPAMMESAETKNFVSKLCASCLHLKNQYPLSP